MAILPEEGGWAGKPYVRIQREDTATGGARRALPVIEVWRQSGADPQGRPLLAETQTLTTRDGVRFVNGRPQGTGPGEADFYPIGSLSRLPDGRTSTGAQGPFEFFRTLEQSEIILCGSETIAESAGGSTTVYYQKPTAGRDVLLPGLSPTFQGLRGEGFTWAKLDFLSLMLALFCGTASLPHILIRYYTVKDQEAVRKSTVVGIASIGFFYVLTLYLGLGAMTSGMLDPTDNNMAAPLLAKSFGELLFAIISAIAFTTVLGTVSGLIMAASGAVARTIS